MRIASIRKINDNPDAKFVYAIRFNNEDKKVIKYFGDFADLIGKIRVKSFDVKTGEWLITQNSYESFLRLDDKIFNRSNPAAVKVREVEEKNITDYENMGTGLKMSLYKYQKELVKFSLDSKSSLIVAPCGSGKSNICRLEIISPKSQDNEDGIKRGWRNVV